MSVTPCLSEYFAFDEKTMAERSARSNVDVYRDLTKTGVLKLWEQWRRRGTRVHLALERYANAFGTSTDDAQLDVGAFEGLLRDDGERCAFKHGAEYMRALVGVGG